jgi:hypothetical protein
LALPAAPAEDAATAAAPAGEGAAQAQGAGQAGEGAAPAETGKWRFFAALYGVAAGMSGDVGVGQFTADVDVGFDDILDNLEFGAMGRARAGYDRWSVSADVIYMELSASRRQFDAEAEQWLVQPVLEYSVCEWLMPYAGARYNNLSADVSGTGPLGVFRSISETDDWWDPVVGTRLSVPIWNALSFAVNADVGGFGAASDLTWQVEPLLNWKVTSALSLGAGYRWLYMDYEQGTGRDRFQYDVLTQGFELGMAFWFD